MAIIAEHTLGRMTIYHCDSGPDFTPTEDGSIAYVEDKGTMFIWQIDQWFAVNVHDSEEIYVNATNSFDVRTDDDGAQGIDTRYIVPDTTQSWTANGLSSGNWSLTNNYRLTYNGAPSIRALVKGTVSVVTGDTNWNHTALLIGVNDSIPSPSIEQASSNDPTAVGGGTPIANTVRVCQLLTLNTGDYLSMGRGSLAFSTGGGPSNNYTHNLNLCTLSVQVVDTSRHIAQTTVFTEDWESGSFATNGWTAVNGGTNDWFVGTATNNGGTFGAYVSDDSGTSNSYNIDVAQVSHVYKDITFSAGANTANISFDWRCTGENAAGDDQYDYLRVFLVETTTTPVAGTQLTTGQIGAIKYNQQATYTSASIDLSSANDFDFDGATYRLVFSWRNDGSVGTDPPAAIDNIVVTSGAF